LNIIKKIAGGLAKTKFALSAINDGADLSAFKEKLTVQNYIGIFLMCCSYLIGWPAVGLFATLSIYWHEPLLIIIGGPLLLVIAHLECIYQEANMSWYLSDGQQELRLRN